MNLKNLFTINAVICLVFGLPFVLFPAQSLSQYGLSADAPLKFMGQLFGSALLAFLVISWKARNTQDSTGRSAIILGFFIGDTIGFVISLINQLNGVVNTLGWLTVAIYLLLALGFGYFQLTASSDS